MAPSEAIADRAEKVIARCKRLASITESPGSTCRTFLSVAMRECYREVGEWLEAAGAQVTIDAAGNLRGFYAGAQTAAPRMFLGSHLDTVPDAGAYDGVLGVVLAVSLLETLDDITREAGGAVYPAKDARMSAASFQRYFPMWQRFSEFIDPKFSSSFWRRVTGSAV